MEKWQVLTIALRWPHQGIMLGFELFEADNNDNFNTLRIHLLLISIGIDWGYEDNPYI